MLAPPTPPNETGDGKEAAERDDCTSPPMTKEPDDGFEARRGRKPAVGGGGGGAPPLLLPPLVALIPAQSSAVVATCVFVALPYLAPLSLFPAVVTKPSSTGTNAGVLPPPPVRGVMPPAALLLDAAADARDAAESTEKKRGRGGGGCCCCWDCEEEGTNAGAACPAEQGG
jgi:hypothetical protein